MAWLLFIYYQMRNFRYIVIVLIFTVVQLKAGNFSEKTDEVSVETIKIYPNPVTTGQNFVIDAKKDIDKIEILNITGECIYSEDVENSSRFQISTEGFKKGLFLIKIIYFDDINEIKRFWVK